MIVEYNVGHIFSVAGYPVWSFLIIKDTEQYNSWELKTLFEQEMFANGIFSIGTHNMSYAHSESDIKTLMNAYRAFFDKVVSVLKNKNLMSVLQCEPLKPLFKVR